MVPIKIRLRKDVHLVTLEYENDLSFDLSFEYLRVFSPSAEVKGHGPGQGVLQTGKESVQITEIEPIGHYALRLIFDDGHDTGLYSWDYLHELGSTQSEKWQDYLSRLKEAGHEHAKSKSH